LTQTFLIPVQENIRLVEALMRTQADGFQEDIKAALNLLIDAGGKRIRPTVSFLTGRIFGSPEDKLVTLAAAIELLHTATLVHDDLIDGSLLRRGSPTLNSQWSPSATVLTGDFLFARAARLAADTGSVECMQVFANTLSIIVNGEINQLFSSRCKVDRSDYYERIYAKTASLFETAVRTAAILSPAKPPEIDAISAYGRAIGIAFQMIDDILDFTGHQATIGKPVGNDLRQGIITLPTIFYLEKYPSDPFGKAFLDCQSPDPAASSKLIERIINSEAIHLAYAEACAHVRQAHQALGKLPAPLETQALHDLADYIVDRKL